MLIGIPKEIKADEYRVSMLPAGVAHLVAAGHSVLVEQGAGRGSGYEDADYAAAGATLVQGHAEVFTRSEMIVKVKEPLPAEFGLLRPGLIMFTYFHFAADRTLTEACLNAGITAMAYETLTDVQGHLPLLTPMSEVAGRLSIQAGARCLENPAGGRGLLLGGVAGVEPANVLILGGGVVGTQAARMASGLGAQVTMMDVNLDRLRRLAEVMPANVTTLYSAPQTLRDRLVHADLVVGAVLVPGGRTPQLIRRDMLATMKPGSVIVDVGVDQGGCAETTRPTTHGDPTYVIDGVVHYAVANMPGAVGRTSTQALCNATLPYILKLATEPGLIDGNCSHLASALNLRDGRITHNAVAKSYGQSA